MSTQPTSTPGSSTTPHQTTWPGQSEDSPAKSCDYIFNATDGAAQSDYYWIEDSSGQPHQIYCLMSPADCNNITGGWMRVAYINMSNPQSNCPLREENNRYCTGITGGRHVCDSVNYTTFGYKYTRICGRALGYMYYTTLGFYQGRSQTLEGAYVDGLSITHGAPGSRMHIWTYAAGGGDGYSRDSYNHCPCATYPSAFGPPSGVGSDYYCESARHVHNYISQWYNDNTLWDSKDCPPGSHCCDNPHAPWFVKTLNNATDNDIEIRWCTWLYQVSRVGIDLMDIYVI